MPLEFRAWDTLIGRMVSWNEMVDGYGDDTMLDDVLTGKRYIPQQYTGLKDKDGRKIFVGDIIKLNSDFRAYQVCFGEVCEGEEDIEMSILCVYGQPKNNTPITLNKHLNMEIVGNIYENPELIK